MKPEATLARIACILFLIVNCIQSLSAATKQADQNLNIIRSQYLEMVRSCVHQLGLEMPQNVTKPSYGFGLPYTNIETAERVCKTNDGRKNYMDLFRCVKREQERTTTGNDDERFYKFLYERVLNLTQVQRGADYLCEGHNRHILNNSRAELVSVEAEVTRCTDRLHDYSLNVTNVKHLYVLYQMRRNRQDLRQVELEVDRLLCVGNSERLQCLEKLLPSRVSEHAALLMLYYYRQVYQDCDPSLDLDFKKPPRARYEAQLQNDQDKQFQGVILSKPDQASVASSFPSTSKLPLAICLMLFSLLIFD